MIISFVLALSFGHPFSYFFSAFFVVVFVILAFWTNFYVGHLDIICRKRARLICQHDELFERVLIKARDEAVSVNLSTSTARSRGLEIGKDEVHIITEASEIDYNLSFGNKLTENFGHISKIRIRLSSLFPYFIFYAWKYKDLETDIYIYPKVDKNKLVEVRDKLQKELSGIELRNYTQGDGLARVYWKKYYQNGDLVVKFEDEEGSSQTVLNENLISTIGDEVGVGVLCQEIHSHIERRKGFYFLDRLGNTTYYSNFEMMAELGGRLINEYLLSK